MRPLRDQQFQRSCILEAIDQTSLLLLEIPRPYEPKDYNQGRVVIGLTLGNYFFLFPSLTHRFGASQRGAVSVPWLRVGRVSRQTPLHEQLESPFQSWDWALLLSLKHRAHSASAFRGTC